MITSGHACSVSRGPLPAKADNPSHVVLSERTAHLETSQRPWSLPGLLRSPVRELTGAPHPSRAASSGRWADAAGGIEDAGDCGYRVRQNTDRGKVRKSAFRPAGP